MTVIRFVCWFVVKSLGTVGFSDGLRVDNDDGDSFVINWVVMNFWLSVFGFDELAFPS